MLLNLGAIRPKDVEIDGICTRLLAFVNEKAVLMPSWLTKEESETQALESCNVSVLVFDILYYQIDVNNIFRWKTGNTGGSCMEDGDGSRAKDGLDTGFSL